MAARCKQAASRCLCAATLFVLAVAPALADEANRARHWELTLQPVFAPSKSMSFDNGSQADLNSGWGFGFGFGYNFDDHFSLGGEFGWNYVGYNATATPALGNPGGPINLNGTLYTSTLRVEGTYNFLRSSVTPFVMGGIGWTYVDTGVQNGPAQTYCWYYPWWGYTCGAYAPTKTFDGWSYNAGVGVRWDITNRIFLRGTAMEQWAEFGGYASKQNWTNYRVDVGFKF